MKIKVIKLDKRYTYYHKGFTHAIKFNRWDGVSRQFEAFMVKQYGYHSAYSNISPSAQWVGYFGREKGSILKPYWICVRNEAVISMALLSINYVKV